MKISKELFKKIVQIIGLLGLGVIMGIVLTAIPVTANLILPKTASLTKLVSDRLNQQTMELNSSIEKKQELETFYKELTKEAVSTQDWEKLYSLVNPADKSWLSLEDYILISKNTEYFSIEYVVHDVQVEDDRGLVDRTIVICSTEECLGESRKEQRDVREYVYIDNQWYQQARKEPSEKASKLAAYMYTNSGSQKKIELAERYGGGVDDFRKIIHTWSIILENDPELMAYDEALVEKHKIESSKSNVYVESPDYPRNCTSYTIGGFTSTDCH